MVRNNWLVAALTAALFTLLLVSENGALAADADHPKIQGVWELTAVERDGQPVPDELIKLRPLKITFEGDKFLFQEGQGGVGPAETGLFKLDSTKTPKQIDVSELGPTKKNGLVGIYELKDDSLKLCTSPVEDDGTKPDRPSEMKSAGRMLVMTLKRMKK
jgi:uncharacterized protein (TIGR03067 family)